MYNILPKEGVYMSYEKEILLRNQFINNQKKDIKKLNFKVKHFKLTNIGINILKNNKIVLCTMKHLMPTGK